MAANKIYTVVKDGEELEKMKNLTAAKKLADTEGADVYSEGRCVYHGTVAVVEDTVSDAVPDTVPEAGEAPAVETSVIESSAEESAGTEQGKAETESVTETGKASSNDKADRYRIKTLMNVRKSPSMEAGRIGLRYAGDVVEGVLKSDWLQLSEGGFVLFGGGEFAEKI